MRKEYRVKVTIEGSRSYDFVANSPEEARQAAARAALAEGLSPSRTTVVAERDVDEHCAVDGWVVSR